MRKHAKDETQILIVDDDQLVRDFAVDTLQYGLNRGVITFESGFDAWQFISSQPDKVDIIIADANIPDMDGFELLKYVKKSLPDKTFIITAGDAELEETASRNCADAFISKPYDVKDLFAVIKKVVKTSNSPPEAKIKVFRENRPPSPSD